MCEYNDLEYSARGYYIILSAHLVLLTPSIVKDHLYLWLQWIRYAKKDHIRFQVTPLYVQLTHYSRLISAPVQDINVPLNSRQVRINMTCL